MKNLSSKKRGLDPALIAIYATGLAIMVLQLRSMLG